MASRRARDRSPAAFVARAAGARGRWPAGRLGRLGATRVLHRGLLTVSTALALMAPSTSVLHARPAIADHIGRPVLAYSVEIEGAQASVGDLRSLVVTAVGMPLDMADVRESLLHLYSLGRFLDVRVEATAAPEGVRLRYLLVPAPRVERVAFEGSLGLARGALSRAIEAQVGEAPSLAELAEMEAVLERLYVDQGFFGARVDGRTRAGQASAGVELVFEIDAGPRARLGRIGVEGAAAAMAADVTRQLGLRSGIAYDRQDIEQRLDRYAADLRRQGYYEAALAHTAAVAPTGETVDLTILVDAGPRVTVHFEGDSLPGEVRDELVPIAREGSVDEDLLEDSSRRLARYLHDQGFWRAAVRYRRDTVDDALRITFVTERGRLYRVAGIELAGNAALSDAELRAMLTLQPGAAFVESTFDADIAALLESYRRRGYVNARVSPDIVESPASAPGEDAPAVTLQVTIDEGVRTLVESVAFEGDVETTGITPVAIVQSVAGQPYYRPQIIADRDALLRALINLGYQDATVQVDASFSDDGSGAALIFVVAPGAQVRVDHVLIVGNDHTSSATIRQAITLRSGEPLSFEALMESQRRLSALGLFRRIRITELRHGGGMSRRDVLVTVEEAARTQVGYGGGLEVGQRLRREGEASGQAVERLEFAPRGFFEVGRRNLWGKNRSVDLFTRISLRPDTDPAELDDRGVGFHEYRVLGTYREPRMLGSEAEGLATAFLEQAVRSSFNLFRRGFHAEVRRAVGPTASLSMGYTFDQNKLFDEQFNPEDQPAIDRLFPEVSLSSFSSTLLRDTRDDPFAPTRGTLLGVDAELAARRLGSEVGYVKTFMQGYLYRQVPGSRGLVLAAGLRLGLATGLPRDVAETDSAGNPILDPDGNALVTEVRDLPASKRFFAGGDTTVRGFALDRLGDAATIDQDGFPQGGNSLLILNTEIRLPVWRDLGAVAFLDAGNVFETVSDFDLGRIRGGAGVGLRYRSPIGPLRVDLGFKLDRQRLGDGRRERPTALHISIGQAF